MRLQFISDAGHGWLRVSIAQAKAVGLQLSDFSSFSYIRGNQLYLEEDLDAGVYLEAFKARNGSMPEFEEIYQDPTPIRNYRRI